MNLSGKRILIIVAFDNFQDIEYQEVRKVLENNNAEIIVASSKVGRARGKLGNTINIEETIYTVDIKNFDAVIFIGGPGAEEYFENHRAYQICHETLSYKKILAAICIAPAILTKAGVLFHKKATIWSSFADKTYVEILKSGNAIFTDNRVQVDGKIITASEPESSSDFAKKIVVALKN